MSKTTELKKIVKKFRKSTEIYEILKCLILCSKEIIWQINKKKKDTKLFMHIYRIYV